MWPVSQSTPDGIINLLATARAAFTLAWFHYELLVVSASWSLLAVEAALRDRLDVDEKPPLKALIARAMEAGLLDDVTADRLDAGRQVRNGLAHARAQQAWTVGMAGPVVRTSHEVVCLLYPDSPSKPLTSRAAFRSQYAVSDLRTLVARYKRKHRHRSIVTVLYVLLAVVAQRRPLLQERLA